MARNMAHPDDKAFAGSFEITDNPSPDKEHDDFFKWIGICIKEWAKIENQLFEICEIVLRTDRRRVAVIYYRTPSIEARISLTSDLLETLWPKKAGEHDAAEWIEWKSLRDDIRKLLPVRNLLAHSPINYRLSIKAKAVDSGDAEILSQNSWIEIATSPQETLRTGTRKTIKLVGDEPNMQTHFRDVRSALNRLVAYRMKLQEKILGHP